MVLHDMPSIPEKHKRVAGAGGSKGKRRLFKTLQSKLLIAFLAVAFIPFGITSYLNYKSTRAALTNAAYNSLFAAASETTVSLDAFISANLEILATQARLPELSEYLIQPLEGQTPGLTKDHMVKILQSFADRDRIFIASCALIDMQGIIVVDTFTSHTGRDVSTKDSFKVALETGRPFVSPVEFSPDDNKAYLYFSSPVFNKEETMVGVLHFRYSASVLQQILVGNSGIVGSESFAVLLDENHFILAHGSMPELIYTHIGQLDAGRVAELQKLHRLPRLHTEKMYTNLPTFAEGLSTVNRPEPFFETEIFPADHKKGAGAVTQMKTRPWLIAFFQPQEVFLAPIQENASKQLYLFIIITGIVAILAIIIARLLSEPIKHLTLATRKVAEGDLSVQTDLTATDEIGTLSSAFNTMTDRLRKREADLSRSEERMRLFFERQLAGMAITSPEKGWLQVNDKLNQILGYSTEELSQRTWADLTHPADLAADEAQFDRLLSGEIDKYTIEKRFIRKDGAVISTNISVGCVRKPDGSVDYVLALLEDTTDRKVAEAALQKSEEKFRFIVQHAPAIFFILDSNGVFLLSEGQGLSRISLTPGQVVGMSAFKIYGDFPAICSSIKRALQGEPTRTTNDIEEIVFDTVYAPYFDTAGLQIGVIGIAIDITEKTKLEEQFFRAQKMKAIGTLAGGVAHDFNNLLTSILGYTSLLLRETPDSHPHFRGLKSIEAQALSAADLTKQLLGFARGGKYEVRPCDLNELIRSTAEMFGRTKKEISITCRLQSDLHITEIDRVQIEQVLMNFLVNAWQAMPEGGSITLTTKNVVFDQQYSHPHQIQPGVYAKVSVTDTGTGMDEMTQKKIFEPFFTTKEKGIGTGLGLASAYGIIKNHGGIINVYSEVGHGSTFTIYLPVSDAGIVTEETVKKDISLGTGTILLVDDQDIVSEVCAEMVKFLGYDVLIARSGQEALEIVSDQGDKLLLVILDMIMPVMSGSETFDRLKQIQPKLPIILSSGYSINGQATAILNKGCAAFIQKPFDLQSLSDKIQQALTA